MNCKYHRDKEAKYICEKCKGPVCEDCAIELNGRKVCSTCASQSLFGNDIPRKRRGIIGEFLFFCFACIPGVAHMFMGLFSRGMQLLITAIGAFVLFGYMTTESFIPLVVIPLWFFSFFDSYNIRKRLDQGEEVPDSVAYDYKILIENKKYLGIGMIVLGIVGVFNCMNYFAEYQIFGHQISTIVWALKRSIFPLALVVIGIYLISKNKKIETEENTIEEDN